MEEPYTQTALTLTRPQIFRLAELAKDHIPFDAHIYSRKQPQFFGSGQRTIRVEFGFPNEYEVDANGTATKIHR